MVVEIDLDSMGDNRFWSVFSCFMCILTGSVYVFEGVGGIYYSLGLALAMGLILFE